MSISDNVKEYYEARISNLITKNKILEQQVIFLTVKNSQENNSKKDQEISEE